MTDAKPDYTEAGRRLFAREPEFYWAAAKSTDLPPPRGLEIAFAGRSNVGKSSLINALVNRNGLARASNTPGRTQELNFFDVGEPPLFRICDMPGYGYAKAPIKTVQKWRYLVNDYLRGRQVLKRTFLLIDSRHGVKEVDREIMKMLDGAAVSYRVVLTKTDKIKASELAAVEEATLAELRKHSAAFPLINATSAEKKGGIEALREAVLEAVVS
jgi:GTP-binding protein